MYSILIYKLSHHSPILHIWKLRLRALTLTSQEPQLIKQSDADMILNPCYKQYIKLFHCNISLVNLVISLEPGIIKCCILSSEVKLYEEYTESQNIRSRRNSKHHLIQLVMTQMRRLF